MPAPAAPSPLVSLPAAARNRCRTRTLRPISVRQLHPLLILSLLVAAQPGEATAQTRVERFNCGALGLVVLHSGPVRFSREAGHTVPAAPISIAARGLDQAGVVDTIMGGNDRTFTRGESAPFRSADDTSAANPVILNILIGDHIYSDVARRSGSPCSVTPIAAFPTDHGRHVQSSGRCRTSPAPDTPSGLSLPTLALTPATVLIRPGSILTGRISNITIGLSR